MRVAVISEVSGLIQNIIELPDDYNPNTEGAYSPPEGFTLREDPNNEAQVDGTYSNGEWTPAPVEEVVSTTQEQLDALTELLKEKAILTDSDISDVRRPAPVTPYVENPRLGRLPEE